MPIMRPMQGNDLSLVMAIEKQAYLFPWSEGNFRDCLNSGYYSQVLEHESKVIGYSVMSMGAGEANILNICVKSEQRGKGWGRLLLDDLIQQARVNEVEMILLEVRLSNISAINLYQTVGFNELGRRKAYYPAGNNSREDALILACQLL